MSQSDLSRFRRMCGQFRWLAVFMVTGIAVILLLTFIGAPLFVWLREGDAPDRARWAAVVWCIPAIFYLFGVWSIGSSMGQLANGRLIQPTLATALRRVGLALGLGGMISVFVVSNLMRLIEQTRGGYLHFDIAGMTLGMIGGALFLLGRVMDQAGRIQIELDEII